MTSSLLRREIWVDARLLPLVAKPAGEKTGRFFFLSWSSVAGLIGLSSWLGDTLLLCDYRTSNRAPQRSWKTVCMCVSVCVCVYVCGVCVYVCECVSV